MLELFIHISNSVCTLQLSTTVLCNMRQNTSDNLPFNYPRHHCCSDVVHHSGNREM